MREDVTHSFYQGDRSHCTRSTVRPSGSEDARKPGKYSWTKSLVMTSRAGDDPAERPAGQGLAAGGPNAAAHQTTDPLFVDTNHNKLGRVCSCGSWPAARERRKYYKVDQGINQLRKLGLSFYNKHEEAHLRARAFGSTEAARGSCRTGS